MSNNLQVAVRVRPFNEREKSMNSSCCIKMNPETQQTIITDPETNAEKPFTFDFSYNSFLDPKDPHFASQDIVWNDLGIKVLEHAWEGFNVSLFAYGQTGAGKSFSMVGYGADKGIIPRASEVIFQRISAAASTEEDDNPITFKVEASMMEIYNEKVKDLFNPSSDNLKVRDNPKKGPYAEGLTRSAVSSYHEINTLMEAGIMARTTASTNMNATSSRAHTIFQIILTQSQVDPTSKKAMDKVSRISLIDLAGSERAASTGATGGRLKEGAAINQSLSALGNVISSLADNANGKKKLVPYRNSKLTHLLKDSLGGNSKTIMIAALSPAAVNYAETLGTLRYADRAKQIKNQAVVNEDPNQKLIRQLKEELLSLKKAMVEGSSVDLKAAAMPAEEAAREAELSKIREQLEENQRLLEESQKTWNERLLETEALAKKREEQLNSIGLFTTDLRQKATVEPHLLNLNEDQLMSEKLFYFLNVGENAIGREDAEERQDIVLGGLGILKQHCVVSRNTSDQTGKDNLLLKLGQEESARVFLNGEKVKSGETKVLNHCDRIMLGNSNVFRLSIPSLRDAEDVEWMRNESKYDWQYAMQELNSKQMNISQSTNAQLSAEAEKERLEMEEKIRTMEERMSAEQKQAEDRIIQQKLEWEAHVETLRTEMKSKEAALSNKIKTGEEVEEEKAMLANAIADQEAKLAEELARADLEFEEKQRDMLEKQEELEKTLKKQVQETRLLAARKQREREERCELDDLLLREIPMINEANCMSEELGKSTGFALKMLTTRPKIEVLRDVNADAVDIAAAIRSELKVLVSIEESGTIRTSVWDLAKFNDRLIVMEQMYQAFIENGRNVDAVAAWEDDPFADAPEAQLIGRSYVYLNTLCFALPIVDSVPVFDVRGHKAGKLSLEITPKLLSKTWTGTSANLTSEEKSHLTMENIVLPEISQELNSELVITVKVSSLQGVPSKLCKDVFVGFQWFDFPDVYLSNVSSSTTVNPTIDFSTEIKCNLTHELLTYLASTPLEFEVYGNTPSAITTSAPIDVIAKAKTSNDSTTKSLLDSKKLPAIAEPEEDQRVKKKKKKKVIEELQLKVKEQAEQISVQEKTLIENTQELEQSLHDVKQLGAQLALERKERDALEQQVTHLSRQNDILKDKIKASIILNPEKKNTEPVVETPVPTTTTSTATVHPVPEEVTPKQQGPVHSEHKKGCIVS